MKTIDSKWVFRIMKDIAGNVYKARLCARGFMQKQGIYFGETFALVVRYDALRVLLAVAVEQDLEMAQFDVETTYCNGVLKKRVYYYD